jgi:hypothetical protein
MNRDSASEAAQRMASPGGTRPDPTPSIHSKPEDRHHEAS